MNQPYRICATARKQARKIARGDPSRWFREDARMAARLATW